jgi:predicted helicase
VTANGKLNWRVEKMTLSKDKTQLRYNEFLTLSGIPPEAYEYRLGNRSALDWAVDQYRVSTDKRSGIVNDPNREDDPEYIVRLIGQVVMVSVETVRLVGELAGLGIDQV